MKKDLTFDERELDEIHHSLYYAKVFHHGTVGHNLLMLVAKLSDAIGFEVDEDGVLCFYTDPTAKDLHVPDNTVRVYPFESGDKNASS